MTGLPTTTNGKSKYALTRHITLDAERVDGVGKKKGECVAVGVTRVGVHLLGNLEGAGVFMCECTLASSWYSMSAGTHLVRRALFSALVEVRMRARSGETLV